MSEIKFEIVKKMGVLSKSASGWAKEPPPPSAPPPYPTLKY